MGRGEKRTHGASQDLERSVTETRKVYRACKAGHLRQNLENSILCFGDYLLSPQGVSSALRGLTSLFGMGRGVTPASKHQH